MPGTACSFEEIPLRDLVATAQADPSDCSEAMNEIVRRFQPRIVWLAARLTERWWLHDDLVQVALMELLKAVRRHDTSRIGFSRYAWLYMVGAARRELEPWTTVETESLSEPTTQAAVEALAATMIEPG